MKCPLTGKPCDKPRTVQFTQIVSGEATELHMCEDCAGKFNPFGNIANAFMHGFDGMPSLAEAVLGHLGANKLPVATQEEESPEIKIPRCECGSSWYDIRKLGRVGCQRCYKTFRNQMMPLLMKLHEGVRHVGKEPLLAGSLPNLKVKLAKAVSDEQFENAALLRDQIKKLDEGELNSP